ncbi:MAG: succinate dehydrogenase flavoprotein subunit [candidate division Zixibacteria bacterium RBG-1]|nr:MAG: succinate dehydrogenase flavoprotein subunit [candidate division Zixibacteria bacterium RBG-1]OGC83303.1 MAG: fumarate reductase/succinate dehydrogenase flavoprotein subunit [candidate division Zixibacteria bacterium RBG_19FT_COMBO_42_43]
MKEKVSDRVGSAFGGETYEQDVIVIGAGGAGLRAAIEARLQGLSVGLICKSLLGKAHTVMAEGGAAAALAYVDNRDSWKVHFRDTLRGGKFLNNYKMALLHAQEAPDRIKELEAWGALFDRTEDGRILQRNFGGHRFPRLAHVGDRTGLEIIRTLQDKAVHLGIDVYMECTITKLLKDGDKISGALGYWRTTGESVLFKAKAIVLATGGFGKAYRVTSNSWEYTGDGHALAYHAGADLIDMEFVQFHPTGMVWPLSVKGILVTEGVRGDGGILKNSKGERFMFRYIPDLYKAETSDTEEEANRWLAGDKSARRPPELLTRDVVAKAIVKEVKEGRGSPHSGVFLDIASRRSAEDIKRKLPGMYQQFKELAGIDITKEPMEVAPTCHYAMGGVRVDAETAAATVPGLFAAGECAGGMHGANRLGGNSLSDLLVFGRRAGLGAAEYAKKLSSQPTVDMGEVQQAQQQMSEPFERSRGETAYKIISDLQEMMETYVGIVREEKELSLAVEKIQQLKKRAQNVCATGDKAYNPGWNYALDLTSLLTVSEAIILAAKERKESRGALTRIDYPNTEEDWGKVNVVIRKKGTEMTVAKEPLSEMPEELKALLQETI